MLMDEFAREDGQDSEDDEDSDADEDDSSKEGKYRGTIVVAPLRDIASNVYQDEECRPTHQLIASSEVLSQGLLPVNQVLLFMYDLVDQQYLPEGPEGSNQLFEQSLRPILCSALKPR